MEPKAHYFSSSGPVFHCAQPLYLVKKNDADDDLADVTMRSIHRRRFGCFNGERDPW